VVSTLLGNCANPEKPEEEAGTEKGRSVWDSKEEKIGKRSKSVRSTMCAKRRGKDMLLTVFEAENGNRKVPHEGQGFSTSLVEFQGKTIGASRAQGPQRPEVFPRAEP